MNWKCIRSPPKHLLDVAFRHPPGVAGETHKVGGLRHQIGALARPEEIRFTDSLPKTRSGKIMRRLLRDVAAGRESTGDTTTLEDYSILAKLRESEE